VTCTYYGCPYPDNPRYDHNHPGEPTMSSDIRETVRHMLANLYHLRILDITDEHLRVFATELDYHNLVLVDKSARFK
jgi:hypothetical protein